MSKNSDNKTNKTEYEKNHEQEKAVKYTFRSVKRGYEYTIYEGETHTVYKDGTPVVETSTRDDINRLEKYDVAEYKSGEHLIGRQIKLQEISADSKPKYGKKGVSGVYISNYAIASKSPEDIIVHNEEMMEKKHAEMTFRRMVEAVANRVLPAGREYEMFCLYYFKGKTLRDIAQRYGIGKSTVERHKDDALEKVRGEFLKEHSKTEILRLLGYNYRFIK